jgi:hypothetical protein
MQCQVCGTTVADELDAYEVLVREVCETYRPPRITSVNAADSPSPTGSSGAPKPCVHSRPDALMLLWHTGSSDPMPTLGW